jgi:hypothetical protein
MRQAICHLDILWFRDAVVGSGVAKAKPTIEPNKEKMKLKE